MDTTIKVSKELFSKIIERAEPGESKDQTLRRVLMGMKVAPRKPRNAPSVVVKLSRRVRMHIKRSARPVETVDATLRRLLGEERAMESSPRSALR